MTGKAITPEARPAGSRATPAGSGFPATSSIAGVAAASVSSDGTVSATAAQSTRKTKEPPTPTEAASNPGVVGCHATRPPTFLLAHSSPFPPLKSAARMTSIDPFRSSTVQTPTKPSSSAVASKRAPLGAPFAGGANAMSVRGALWPLARARTAFPPSRASSLTAPVPKP